MILKSPEPVQETGFISNLGDSPRKRGPPSCRKPPFDAGNYSLLNYIYVNGLLALGTRANFELDGLTFVE